MSVGELSLQDRFEIFEQLQLHQHYIDTPFGSESVKQYQSLYWPECKFTVRDLRSQVFEGYIGMKTMFDFAHSVFPIEKWFHTMGSFEIRGAGTEATANWRWLVSWREDNVGTVSTGTYADRFQKRDGVWKCLERLSQTDPNWPEEFFQTFLDKAPQTSRES
jgi:hypothetical protein